MHDLIRYRVILTQDPTDLDHTMLYFDCEASDVEDAYEQAQDAYPQASILTAIRKPRISVYLQGGVVQDVCFDDDCGCAVAIVDADVAEVTVYESPNNPDEVRKHAKFVANAFAASCDDESCA